MLRRVPQLRKSTRRFARAGSSAILLVVHDGQSNRSCADSGPVGKFDRAPRCEALPTLRSTRLPGSARVVKMLTSSSIIVTMARRLLSWTRRLYFICCQRLAFASGAATAALRC